MIRITALAVLLSLSPALLAADKTDTEHGDAMIDKYLAGLTKETSPESGSGPRGSAKAATPRARLAGTRRKIGRSTLGSGAADDAAR